MFDWGILMCGIVQADWGSNGLGYLVGLDYPSVWDSPILVGWVIVVC